MGKRWIAIGLLIASLILLSIYGADVIVASSSRSTVTPNQGFLPLPASVRGEAFGGGAVIMSIAGFAIAFRETSFLVAVLLFANGGLIISGMIGLISQGALSGPNTSSVISTVGSTFALGLILVGLGVWKSLRDRRVVTRSAQAQK